MNTDQLLDRIYKNVRNLDAYHLELEEIPVKLNQNENPFDWSKSIKNEVAEFCKKRSWNRYPDFIPNNLKADLSEYTGVPSDSIIAGNGSNEMLLVLLLSLTDYHEPVIICQPSFTLYQLLSKGLGRYPCEVYFNQDLTFNIDDIIKASLEKPYSVIIINSPNNPTGSSIKESQICKILENHRGFLILDQAYVEFGGYNAIPLLTEYPNLIITRTLSKAFSGAGIRFGYMLGKAEIIKEINKIKLPYNINFFTEHVATILLSHTEEFNERIDRIVVLRQRMYEFLKTLPFDNVYHSDANFVCIRTEYKSSLFSYLKERGILIRDVSSYPMLENCLRISIGTEKENEKIMEALSGFFKTIGKSI